MKEIKEIKEIVTEQEMKKINRVIEEIYSIEYDNNYSVAYNLGFDTVSNLNGRGYENLILIIDRLNDGGEDEAFARYILGEVLPGDKIERLKKELSINRNKYIRFLYL